VATPATTGATNQSAVIFGVVAIYSHCCGESGKISLAGARCLFGMLRSQMTPRFKGKTFLVKNLGN
jgi:hypothetical protein